MPLFLGVLTLVFVIVLLDQLVWRPLIAWTDRFKVDMVEGEEPPTSWFLDLISRAWLVEQFGTRVWRPFSEWVESGFQRRASGVIASPELSAETGQSRFAIGILTVFLLVALYGGFRAATLLATLPSPAWVDLGKGILATFLRVSVALAITLVWTIPVGVVIGTNRRLANVLQPIVQVVASVPATAIFPVVLLALLDVTRRIEHCRRPTHVNGNAVVFAIQCNRWCGGDSARFALHDRPASSLFIGPMADFDFAGAFSLHHYWERSRRAAVPGTQALSLSSVEFGGQTHATVGAGALIANATGTGDYALLLAATLALVFTVVLINRTFWRRLYRLAEERYRME